MTSAQAILREMTMPTTLDAYPVTLCLEDGRTLFVELPAKLVRHDRDGTVGYTVEGMRRLDQLRAVATEMGQRPTGGHIAALRGALGFTQSQLGDRIGVDKLTVSRWERGEVRPGAASVRRLQRLRQAAGRKGIVLNA